MEESRPMQIIDFRSYAPLKATMDFISNPQTVAGKYVSQYGLTDMDRHIKDIPAFEKHMDDHGISHTVIACNGSLAEDVVAFANGSKRVVAIADIRPQNPAEVVRRIQRLYDNGARLVGLTPWKEDIPANDRIWYPIYAKCCELGMGCVIHASFHFGKGVKLRSAHPLNLDDVAVDFPELRIVASHGGWPWMSDMVAVAWHHEHVYVELSGWRFKYLPQEHSGWDMIFQSGNGPLRDKILWGALWPFMPLDRQIAESKEMPFSPAVQQKLFHDNAHRLLTELKAI